MTPLPSTTPTSHCSLKQSTSGFFALDMLHQNFNRQNSTACNGKFCHLEFNQNWQWVRQSAAYVVHGSMTARNGWCASQKSTGAVCLQKNVARSRCSSHCSVLATEPHQAIQNTSLVHSNDCFDPITMIYQLYRKLQTSNGDVLKKIWSSGDSPATFWWFSCDVAESCLCNWRTPTQATAKKQDWKVVVWALVPFVRITWMLLCS